MLCRQAPPPTIATLRPTDTAPIYPQRNNDPRAPTPSSPSPNFPPPTDSLPHLFAEPSVALPPRPIATRPASAPHHLVRPRPTDRPHATGSKTDTLSVIWIYRQHTNRRRAIALFFRRFSAPPKSRTCCFLRIIAIFVSSKIGACLDKNFLNISITSKSFIYVQRTS